MSDFPRILLAAEVKPESRYPGQGSFHFKLELLLTLLGTQLEN